MLTDTPCLLNGSLRFKSMMLLLVALKAASSLYVAVDMIEVPKFGLRSKMLKTLYAHSIQV